MSFENTNTATNTINLFGIDIESGYFSSILIAFALIVFIYVIIEWDNTHSESRINNNELFITFANGNKLYDNNTNTYGRYCNNCGELGQGGCNECFDCGYCYNENGVGECVSGDENGPYFRDDCYNYEYRVPFYYNRLYPTYYDRLYSTYYDRLYPTYYDRLYPTYYNRLYPIHYGYDYNRKNYYDNYNTSTKSNTNNELNNIAPKPKRKHDVYGPVTSNIKNIHTHDYKSRPKSNNKSRSKFSIKTRSDINSGSGIKSRSKLESNSKIGPHLNEPDENRQNLQKVDFTQITGKSPR